jgi:hypothetical protein
MNNKIFLITIIMFLSLSKVHAESDKLHVEIMEEFSTINPSQSIDVRAIEGGRLGIYTIKPGDIIHCNVIKITNPKRGKRSASFGVTPIYLTSEGETTEIKEILYGKYAERIFSKEEIKNIDTGKVGKKAVIAVGNHFVKGVAPIASLAEGMIKNEEGNRVESGVIKVYKDSPLSYVEKGKELELEPGKSFYLIFKPEKK